MDQGPLTIALDESTRARLEVAAGDAGLSVEEYIVGVIHDFLSHRGVAEDAAAFEGSDDSTEESRRYRGDQAALALAEYDRTGAAFPLEEVLTDLRADLEARLTSRA